MRNEANGCMLVPTAVFFLVSGDPATRFVRRLVGLIESGWG